MVVALALGGTTAIAPAVAIAGPVPSGVGVRGSQRGADVARIEEQLADPAIQAALRQAGTDPAELRDRLRELGDHDVHLLASRLDDVKSGGLITEVLVIVVLVLLILYLVKLV